MQAVVNRTSLHRALSRVERATARNAALPILSNILLSAAEGKVLLSATNLEVGINASVGAKIGAPGKIAVPGRLMSELVRAASADTVELSVKQGVLSVTAGSHRTAVLCFDAAEYPIIPTISGGLSFTVPGGNLKRVLEGVIDSVATSDARPELAGALVRIEKGTLVAAATDSFRLSERSTGEVSDGDALFILPRAAVIEVIHAVTDPDEQVTIRIADNQVSFITGEADIVSRLVDGRYPDYRKVIPERAVARALVRSADLDNAVRVAALFSSSIADIHLSCASGKLTVSSKNASRGEGTVDIEANLKGEPFELAMNYHYLLDGLKATGAEKTVLEFTGKGSPFAVRPGDGATDSVYLIMPLRG